MALPVATRYGSDCYVSESKSKSLRVKFGELKWDNSCDILGHIMIANQADPRLVLRRALGATSPPKDISQEPYKGDPSHLYRLLRLQPGERPRGDDLHAYMEDLNYTEIQSSLLVYLLPICLEMWRNDLRGIDRSYGGVVEYFYRVLANRKVFELNLTPKQTATVSQFMGGVILEEIDDQRGLHFKGAGAQPYRWFGELATYGVILPDIERLWTPWWSIDSVGQAIATVQYISCLMYSEYENPIFAPWTPNGGGGPPCLWEFEGHLYENNWIESNVAFLRRVLTVDNVERVLAQAVKRLVGQPNHQVATEVHADFPMCAATVEARCAELPHILQTTQAPGKSCAWSTSP